VQRKTWASQPGWRGQELTALVPHLDEVEVDNSIAANDACDRPSGIITVVELNAERGRHWLHALPLLRGADIIILNEMDIGMARSGQQHTTQHLARALGMNYAWGLEFVELTAGTLVEQRTVGSTPNFLGLHGNAFMTRCRIADAVIYRDEVGPYFSDSANHVNADGHEKRLGGRMGVFGRIAIGGRTLVIGSTHKVEDSAADIRAYIGTDKAITGGDQDRAFCGRIGLASVDNASAPTWPASCTSPGSSRGDNLCSNLRVAVQDETALPCSDRFGVQALLSDHAVVRVGLML
jgi:hypothetical protein